MSKQLEQTVHKVVANMEEGIDAEIERLDNLKVDDLEAIRLNRINAYKAEMAQKLEWQNLGHGHYDELKDEKEFFSICKKSTNVVTHFYKDGSQPCRIVDHHLAILAAKHIECRFIKLNAEKCSFLAERFGLVVMPTILLIQDNKVKDKIVGFSTLGNREDFSTNMLKWRIAVSGVITTNMDLTTPPDESGKKKVVNVLRNKTIRQGGCSDDSDVE